MEHGARVNVGEAFQGSLFAGPPPGPSEPPPSEPPPSPDVPQLPSPGPPVPVGPPVVNSSVSTGGGATLLHPDWSAIQLPGMSWTVGWASQGQSVARSVTVRVSTAVPV